MSGWKKLAAASAADDVISPEAVSFDGSNDYLQRSFSETTRSAMTFSAWVYASPYTNNKTIFRNGATTAPFEFNVQVQQDGDLEFRLTTGNQSKSAYGTNKFFGLNSWNHILFSIDVSASTAQLFINDRDVGIGASGLSGEDIKPLLNNFQIMKGEATGEAKGRVANVFVDYTYRNLYTESNRRLFITDELKPADGLASLSPIIYLPMTDADTAGTNAGTGGDFTVTGTLDTAARGPNQNNIFSSSFDGSDDYLDKTSLSYGSDSKKATNSMQFKINSQTNNITAFALADNIATRAEPIRLPWSGSKYTVTIGHNLTTGPTVFQFTGTDEIYLDRWYQVDWSVDLTDTAKRHVFINGVAANGTWNDYSNTNIDFSALSEAYIGAAKAAVSKLTGEIGTVWYAPNQYIDLSAENPFYDVENDKPKYLGASGDLPYGSSPLIYLPLRASNPGQNFGTGGDFNVNSRPGGARSSSEFITRSLYTNGSGYLSRTSLTGAADTKTFTLAIALDYTRNSVNEPFAIASTNAVSCVRTYAETGGKFSFQAYNSSDSRILLWESQNGVLNAEGWSVVLFSVNLATSTAHFYVDGVSVTTSADTLTNDFIDLSNINKVTIGADTDGTDIFDDSLALCYFSTDYHDFSQEENRFKFVDQLGYPKDLSQQIADGVISDPLIYPKFTDTDDLGVNAGTGGDFTVNGTVKPGPDVDVDD
jgi:hypothetical protein